MVILGCRLERHPLAPREMWGYRFSEPLQYPQMYPRNSRIEVICYG